MIKKLSIGFGILFLVIAAGLGYLWYQMQQPLYTPGMVREQRNLRSRLVAPPQQQRVSAYWQVEPDIRLHHFSSGAGKPVLVVHGGPGVPFTRPIAALKPIEEEHEFVYYDQRGSGDSSRPFDRFVSGNFYQNMTSLETTLGIGAQIADLERMRLILVQDKVILFGHSFGAFLASLYAAEFPDRVQALVLVAPANLLVMPVPEGGLFGTLRAVLPENMQHEYSRFIDAYLDFGKVFAKSEQELAGENRKFAQYYRAAAEKKGFIVPESDNTNGGWMVSAMYFSMGKRHDYRAALKAVQCPVLVLHGDRDLQSEADSRSFADAFPKADFRTIRNAGHFVFEDQPAAFAEAVRVFLNQNIR
jgi:proline iminopeptidase